MPHSRREFLKTAAACSTLALTGCASVSTAATGRPRLTKPKRLAKGATIGVIAPGSGVKPESYTSAVSTLEGLGFRIKNGRYAQGHGPMYSGTEAERVYDLHAAFADAEVDGIWCLRGGIGVQRLLPLVDFSIIRQNPKVLIGFSDITALHVAIHRHCGLVTFHGPVGISTFSDYTRQQVLDALTSTMAPRRIPGSPFNAQQTDPGYKADMIAPGKARGHLVGGNLTVFTNLIGTPWALSDVKGAILFLEDVDETPQKIERMLTQLDQALDFRRLAGVALGVFRNCVPKPDSPSPPAIDILKSHFANLGVPVAYGLSFGHIRDHFTIPYGIEAELDASAGTLTLMEAGVA